MATLSPRLQMIVDALPLRPGMRVLEIGCGPGAAARAIAQRVGGGFVLAIDRSARAIDAAISASRDLVAAGSLQFRHVAAEDLELNAGEKLFDLALAVRVGAFDGRHPAAGELAKKRLRSVLRPGAPFYIDGGDPLRRIPLDD
jgi:cyclopropane fatty-acyl-phospholipid synthase-like methyltransferase